MKPFYNHIPNFTIIFFFISCLYLTSITNSYSQTHPPQMSLEQIKHLEQEAQLCFDDEEYLLAIEKYNKLLLTDSLNKNYLYKITVCYIECNVDKSKAYKYIDKINDYKDAGNDLYITIGKAYMYNCMFIEAQAMFTKLLETEKNDKEKIAAVQRYKEECNNAAELISKPIAVNFENAGALINSSLPDYAPYMPADKSCIIFSSKRNFNREFQYYATGIYLTKFTNNAWTKANPFTTINSMEFELETAGISPEGNLLFIHQIGYGNVHSINTASRKSKYVYSLDARTPLYTTINPVKTNSYAACISKDGNTVYFSTQLKGGLGGYDIYFCKKNNNGSWSTPKNIGNNINTKYNENYPMLYDNDNSLYFASEGHNSMGGYDLFKATYDENTETFSEPVNLGYPINTFYDDYTICFINPNEAYIAATRKEGIGDMDLYKITLLNTTDLCLIKGKLNISGLISTRNAPQIVIRVFDKYKNVYGQFYPDKITLSYNFSLPKGIYQIHIIPEKNYESIIKDITITDEFIKNKELKIDFTI